jgi:hypothetical protein
LVEVCSRPSSFARNDERDLPGLPRLTLANFRPQIRDQVRTDSLITLRQGTGKPR